MRRVAVLLAAGLLLAGACTGEDATDDGAAPRPEDGVALVGDDIGESVLPGLGEGAEVVSLPDRRGQPVVVNFFASTCAPCVQEMPALEEVHRALADQVAFVGVAVRDRPEEALALVESTGVTYALANDPAGEQFAAAGFTFLPATVVLDADGEVATRIVGEIEGGELRDALAELGVVG